MISAPFLFRLGTGGIERPSRNYIPTRVWKKSQKKKRIEARRTGRFPKRRR